MVLLLEEFEILNKFWKLLLSFKCFNWLILSLNFGFIVKKFESFDYFSYLINPFCSVYEVINFPF